MPSELPPAAAGGRSEAIPSSDFRPTVEEIRRFSATVSATTWMAMTGGLLRYGYEARGEADGRIVSDGLPAGITLRPWQDLPCGHVDGWSMPGTWNNLPAAYQELVIRRRGGPLRDVGLDPDPLTAFASLAGRVDADELVEIAISWLPLTARQAAQWGKESDQYEALSATIWKSLTYQKTPARRAPARGGTKVRSVAPLPLYVSIGVAARAPSRRRAHELTEEATKCFQQFTAGSFFQGRRAGAGVMRRSPKWRRQVATADEIGALLLPPKATCAATNVVRGGARIPDPPPGLRKWTPDVTEDVPLGYVTTPQGRRMVGWPAAEILFGYSAGASGAGKTTRSVNQFLHLVRGGAGGMFFDPDRDAVEQLKRYLGGHAEWVTEINLAPQGGGLRVPGWNPIAVRNADEIDDTAGDIVDSFAAALGWSSSVNSRAITLTLNVARSLCELALRLPPEDCPTIFQSLSLIGNDTWRETVVPHLSQGSQQYWRDFFPKLPAEAVTPVAQMAQRLRASAGTMALLGQSASTYRVSDAMDEGRIVLVCPAAAGEQATHLLTSLLTADAIRAALARKNRPAAARRRFWIYVDEVQELPWSVVARGLEHARKYEVRILAANQNPMRLDAQAYRALATNSTFLATGGLDADGAARMAKEWQGKVSAGALQDLPLHTAVVSARRGGEWTTPFRVEGARVEDLWGPGDPDAPALIAAASGGRSPAEVAAELDTLDRRILERLGPATRARARTRTTLQSGRIMPDG